jgi:cell division protein FtsN
MKLKSWLASALLVVAVLAPALPAAAVGRDLAVLVVGRATDTTLSSRERAVIDMLTKLRVQRGWSHKLLPIYSYHFDKSQEMRYCEDRLKIKPSDLVVVGLVELESGVPVDFVYRENDVTSAEPVAQKVMDRAHAELAARGKIAATTPVAPSPPTHTVPATVSRPTPAHVAVAAPSPSPRPPAHVAPRPPAHASATPVVVRTSAPVGVSAPGPTRPASPPHTSAVQPASTPHPVAVQPAVVQPAAPPAANPNEHWAVQVGLFSTLEKARLMVEKMKELNLQAQIRKGTKDGQVVYRVVVGSFGSQKDAYTQAKTLQESGVQAFSVRVDAGLGIVVK